MAVNLRLAPGAEEALRERATASGRSQQEILRAAVDAYLGREGAPATGTSDLGHLTARGRLQAARAPYRRPPQRYDVPSGLSSLEALDRDDSR